MNHETSLIAIIAVGLTLAFVFGFAAARLRLPVLVGYLLAGVAVGPFTPGFVGDAKLAHQLAEIGVILLMFSVGMHFSAGDLWAVRKIALPGAVVQIAAATAMGVGVAALWGWSFGAGLVFGLALSVASTVVLLKALEVRGRLDSHDGRIAVGWLIVEDLAIVLALVMLPALAGVLGGVSGGTEGGLWMPLGLALGKVTVFVVLMLVVGTRVFPWVLKRVEETGSRELFTLAVVGQSVGIAFAATEVFGVSFALGAFFAGMVLNESESGHKAAKSLQPLEDVFAVLFFVSVGMLFDPRVLVEQPLRVLTVVGIIMVGKSLAALGIVLALRGSRGTALTVSAALAQIGEFSFILAGLGAGLGLMPTEGQSLIVAGAILSITLNPLAFYVAARWSHDDRPAAEGPERKEAIAAETR